MQFVDTLHWIFVSRITQGRIFHAVVVSMLTATAWKTLAVCALCSGMS